MKQQITTFRTSAAPGILIIAAVLCAFLSVSCSVFDDSSLRDSIEELEQRIAALEESANVRVEALADMINGRITVSKVETDASTGKTVITFSDCTVVVISPEMDFSSFNHIITVISEDGGYYWALYDLGQEPHLLIIDGKKVPLTVTPSLKIEQGKWYISVDGGTTWVDTGIQQKEVGENEEVVIFTGVSQDSDNVYLTLADGTVIRVPRQKQTRFMPLAGKQYFACGQTRSLKMWMEDVVEYTLTEVPDGWKASIVSGIMSVTSPSQESGCDRNGTIKAFATFTDGSVTIAKVRVSLDEPDFVLSVEGDEAVITLTAAGESHYEHYQDGYGYFLGAVSLSEFVPDDIVGSLNKGLLFDPEQRGHTAARIPLKDLAGPSYEQENEYMVYATDYVDISKSAYKAENLQYTCYAPYRYNFDVNLEMTAYDEGNVSVTFDGCDGFYMRVDMKAEYDPAFILEDMVEWGWSYILYDTAFSGKLSDLRTIRPGNEYVLWVLPHTGEKNVTGQFIARAFSSPSPSAGAPLDAPSFTLESTGYSKFSGDVTPASGAYKTYASAFEKDRLPADDESLVSILLGSSNVSEGEETVGFRDYGSYPSGAELVIAAVSFLPDGSYGTIMKQEITLEKAASSEDVKVTFEKVTVGKTNASIKMKFEGSPALLRYVNTSNTWGLEDMEDQIANSRRWDISEVQVADLRDNTLVFEDLIFGMEYGLYIIAYDASGNMSRLASVKYTPAIDVKYIRQSNPDWPKGKPSFSNEYWDGPGWELYEEQYYHALTDLYEDLTLPEGCKKAYVWARDPEYLLADTEYSISDKTIVYGTEYTSSGRCYFPSVNYSTHIYVVWVDDNDEYHSYYEYVPTYPAKPGK